MLPSLPVLEPFADSLASERPADNVDPRIREAERLEAQGLVWSARDIRRELAANEHAAQRKAVEADCSRKDRLHTLYATPSARTRPIA